MMMIGQTLCFVPFLFMQLLDKRKHPDDEVHCNSHINLLVIYMVRNICHFLLLVDKRFLSGYSHRHYFHCHRPYWSCIHEKCRVFCHAENSIHCFLRPSLNTYPETEAQVVPLDRNTHHVCWHCYQVNSSHIEYI